MKQKKIGYSKEFEATLYQRQYKGEIFYFIKAWSYFNFVNKVGDKFENCWKWTEKQQEAYDKWIKSGTLKI